MALLAEQDDSSAEPLAKRLTRLFVDGLSALGEVIPHKGPLSEEETD
jgi:hypothetical protein